MAIVCVEKRDKSGKRLNSNSCSKKFGLIAHTIFQQSCFLIKVVEKGWLSSKYQSNYRYLLLNLDRVIYREITIFWIEKDWRIGFLFLGLNMCFRTMDEKWSFRD